MIDLQAVLLVVSGTLVSIFAVVIGGGFFFAIPIFQLLFPGLSFGAVVGNLKFGSMCRGISSTITTRKEINWKECIYTATPFLFGTAGGVYLISDLHQRWILVFMVFAIILAEFAKRISKFITKTRFAIGAFLVGMYTGVLGAGSGVLILALLRVKEPDDSKVADLKIQTRVLELILCVGAVLFHFYHGNLILAVFLWWSIGCVIGGYIGGRILLTLREKKERLQLGVLRGAYSFSLITSLFRFFGG